MLLFYVLLNWIGNIWFVIILAIANFLASIPLNTKDYSDSKKLKLILKKEALFVTKIAIIALTAYILQEGILFYKVQSCNAAGGRREYNPVISMSELASFKCNPSTQDAGKTCTDSSQCEAYCYPTEDLNEGQAVTGKCFEWKYSNQCRKEIKYGSIRIEGCTF